MYNLFSTCSKSALFQVEGDPLSITLHNRICFLEHPLPTSVYPIIGLPSYRWALLGLPSLLETPY